MKTISICILLFICLVQVYSEVRYSVTTKQISEKPSGSTPMEFANNLRDLVLKAPQPTGYCFKNNPTFPLNNQSMCGGPNRNIGWMFNFVFDDAETADYTLEFGTDFGYGAAIFIDQEFYSGEDRDMWWAKNWGSNAVFRLSGTFDSGRHQIVVYGAEGCCDGQMDVRFSRNGGEYQEFSLDNLKDTIPEPSLLPRPTNGGLDCLFNWSCEEFDNIINQACPQTNNNEYIECAIDIIDTQLADCTDAEKQPNWGQEQDDDTEEENPVPETEPEAQPESESEPEFQPPVEEPPSACETCDEDLEEDFEESEDY